MQLPVPTKSRILVFTVPVKRKFANSLLYTPATRRGSYSGCQSCWIISTGPEVKESIKRGQKAYVHDGFEFEEIKRPELWEHYQNAEEFKALKEYVDSVDGLVAVQLVPEGSVLAVED